ncbi:glutamine-hydrolyzing carbamoyl-phosphate synthase small subunit [Candidatus Desulforudis audaxviator]|uniref:Carbamoyl phosphate synthase small chain n=1 Tax=Desulforudis audaxviator (strain MP104C) TaxID=477974 RepID=B1I4M9_DESAP|nr:glutamine-hydrolyzing carbamoyl-phosphate synthase small subunit [Candidatus Desulforudis audaxviator]ACA59814.1 carbamoyl-phosphate synthase, small subunit [Candidatus Desulforudis audaxviator MP104C]AZK59817.1 Carbamoyl-phosphate synthase small chain [Candidatus Desulforudis audaxviator]
MQAVLALEDGTLYYGRAFGAGGENWGEVVFNTGMTGYEGVLTDPSYCGQIVVMTYPLVGNYGINSEDFESRGSFVRGFVVREVCDRPSNWKAAGTLAEFLANEGVIGLAGVDTRALTRRLRTKGTMRGIISTKTSDPETLIEKARSCPDFSAQDFIPTVATKEIVRYDGGDPVVALIDLGAKQNIVRCLQRRGCTVVVFPPDSLPADILALDPAGVVISNGPGDPVRAVSAIAAVRELAGKKPLFGICLGHQVLALALGARTYKLKFGHRGSNHPVKDLATGKVYISSHNHGFSVAEESLGPAGLVITHRSLNDGTVEGFRHRELPVMAVQYHPEAGPGPHDSEYLFDEFLELIGREGN